jgi:hypothetical protein
MPPWLKRLIIRHRDGLEELLELRLGRLGRGLLARVTRSRRSR